MPKRSRNSKLDQAVGFRVRAARLERNYSQQQAGEALGISSAAFCNIELGRTSITIGLLQDLSKLLYQPIQWFMEDLDRMVCPTCNQPLPIKTLEVQK